jgi:hypothetical protein
VGLETQADRLIVVVALERDPVLDEVLVELDVVE